LEALDSLLPTNAADISPSLAPIESLSEKTLIAFIHLMKMLIQKNLKDYALCNIENAFPKDALAKQMIFSSAVTNIHSHQAQIMLPKTACRC